MHDPRNMVSHSQYLCQDFLNPLPSSADTGKSHLALLEKTCFSIGMSDPPTKTGKSALPATGKPSSVSPGSSSVKSSKDQSNSVRSPGNRPTDSTKTQKQSKELISNGVHSSQPGHKPTALDKVDENDNHRSKENGVGPSEIGQRSPTKSGSRPTSARPTSATTVRVSSAQNVPSTIPAPASTSKAAYPTLPSSYSAMSMGHLGANPYMHGLPMPLAAAYPNLPGFAPGSAGSAAIPKMCMDPGCKGCLASGFGLPSLPVHGRACPTGCLQCASAQSNDLSNAMLMNSYNSFLHSLSGIPPSAGFPPVFPGINPMSVSSAPSISTPVPPALNLNNLSNQGTGPHVCVWVTPEGVCLRRFNSNEDLLDHVKTHTTGQQDSNSSHRTASHPLLNYASSPVGIGGFPQFPAQLTGRISPRTACLTSYQRYHPYKNLSPTSTAAALNPMTMPHLPFPPAFGASANYASALSALYAGQKLPGSLP